MRRKVQLRESRSETETFEHLVEDQDDEEHDEFIGDTEGETDNDRVQHHTKLENTDGDELCDSLGRTSAVFRVQGRNSALLSLVVCKLLA